MNTTKKCYEVAVIGSGPAGQRAAIQCAKKGKSVIVIDRREYKLGGVSLHSGTIPSKTLREAVLYLKGIRRRKIYGPSSRFNEEITLETLIDRVDIILEYEMKVIESQFARNGVDVMYGQAAFLDPHRLEVTSREGDRRTEIEAEKIVVATGTVPRHPPDIPFDYKVVFDSNFIFSSKSKIDKLPRSLVVYGAGVIGSEYAAMFAALGAEVKLVDSHKNLFPFLDRQVVDILQDHLQTIGVEILMDHPLEKIEITEAGKGRLVTQNGKVLEADAILFSKGRVPCVEPLRAEGIGIELSERKLIKVNDFYQTSLPHIYACGDVVGFPALASTSAEQGRVAARHALNLDIKGHRPELFPVAIYTIPEIAVIGKTEEQIQAENIPYEKGVAFYNEVAKAAIAGDDTGAIKILFQRDDRRILGIHIIGEQAAEIVHIGQAVMACKQNLNFFLKNVFNYPTWAEAYKLAALNGLNKI